MSSVWLSRTLLHRIVSEPADAGGKSAIECFLVQLRSVGGREGGGSLFAAAVLRGAPHHMPCACGPAAALSPSHRAPDARAAHAQCKTASDAVAPRSHGGAVEGRSHPDGGQDCIRSGGAGAEGGLAGTPLLPGSPYGPRRRPAKFF